MSWPAIDATHDPALACWVPGAEGHADFPVQNLPFGIVGIDGADEPAVAIGDRVLRLARVADLLPEASAHALGPTLNRLFALPPAERLALRRRLSALLGDPAHRMAVAPALASDVAPRLPFAVGDYTDFYAGIRHAENVGRLFRPDQPLLPNYKHVPIGYHGRASTVRVSGEPVTRPWGQRRGDDGPVFAPAARLDHELELGVWIAGDTGAGVPVARAGAHVAGLCLLNDWSARDVQAWEYQPLGPFLAKSFHTSVSPWVVTAEALAPFRIAQPPRPEGDPAPLPYLCDEGDQQAGAFAIVLKVALSTAAMRARGLGSQRMCRVTADNLYWTVAQLIAHHTSNGCALRPGDLLGSGTISGADDASLGSLLEITRGGAAPFALPGGDTRTFLEDGDEVILSATAGAAGFASIGFGECRATVVPATPPCESKAWSPPASTPRPRA